MSITIKNHTRALHRILFILVISTSPLALGEAPTSLTEPLNREQVDQTQIIKQYQVRWTNVNTENFNDINYFLDNSETSEPQLSQFSHPKKTWQINEPIIIEFTNPIFQGDLQSLHFVASNQSLIQYADSNGFLGLQVETNAQGTNWNYQQVFTISPALFYLSEHQGPPIQRKVLNFPLDTTYSVYAKAYVRDELRKFRLFTFKTPAIGVFSKRSISPIDLPDDWLSSLTPREKKNLEASQNQHRKESAQENLRSFSGKGVTIALQDDGIRQDSYANARVGFKLQDLPDSLLGKPDQQGATHGTLMANFLIDYAPSVTLLDFNVFPYVQHLNKKLALGFQQYQLKNYDYAGLAYRLGADLMNVSLTSPRLQTRSLMWISAILSGLVISKSLGNNAEITHQINLGSCSDPTHFVPYFANNYYDAYLERAEGALVTLQAALKTSQGYVSIRSRAGDAAPYTLTVLETQRGATSQAAATFSGIFALIKEVANRYNRNYSNKQLVEILFETADDIGDKGVDPIYGYGLVNIDKALETIERGYAPSITLYNNLNTDIDNDMLEKIYQDGCPV